MSTTAQHSTVGTRQLGHRSMEEEVRVADLPVRGEIPRWLTGSFMRGTPAKLDIGGKALGHWFDGLGMLNVFGFHAGRVSYASRFLQTPVHRAARNGRYDAAISIATDPCRKLGKRLVALFDPSLIAEPHVNILKLGERYLSVTEAPCPVEFDPDTLDTKFVGIRDSLRDFHGTFAHPQFEPGVANQVIACVTRIGVRSEHRIIALDEKLQRRYLGGAPSSINPEYMHSFAMTPRHIVLVLHPLSYSIPAILRTGRYADGFRWQPEKGTRFVVIDRSTGKVRSEHTAPALFFWHTVNAYDQGEDIVVELVASDTPQQIWDLELANLRNPDFRASFCGELRRYRLPLVGPAHRESLSDLRIEFPRIDDRRNTLPHRYVHAVAYRDGDSDWFDQLVRLDVVEGTALQWNEPGCYPSEPVFVPTPGSNAEDDGVVLNIVLDSNIGRSFLLVLDAATYVEIGRAELPHHLPFNFHQQYFG